ncbi:P-loop NTPase [Salinispira pacifica]
MILNEKAVTRILPVASGKGGVGKTFVASNLALRLAANGHDTIVVDLDLGGSNLHSSLGLKNTNLGIGNLLSDSKLKLSDIVTETPFAHLKLIPGDVLVTGVSNLQPAQRRQILGALEKLDAEYIVLDLGSGANFNVVDFMLMSNSAFVVTVPQRPAVINAYGLLKNMTFRALQQTFSGNRKISGYLTRVLKEKRPGGSPTIREIVDEIGEKETRSGKKAKDALAVLQPKVIVNMGRSVDDLDIVENLHATVEKNLQINLECLGMVAYDRRVLETTSELEPVTEAHPESVVAGQLERIAQKILQSDNFPYMPLDLEAYKDTYELARIEAEDDFAGIQQEAETAAGAASLETAELIELISEQKKQIRELRGAVRMLTMRQQ